MKLILVFEDYLDVIWIVRAPQKIAFVSCFNFLELAQWWMTSRINILKGNTRVCYSRS